ncbi:dUTP diphosphatase [Mycobacterium sp. KBS0706]|uniref:dUTP diphosphatase n=1 Tax=Mycobacterium sp. KBS0706 TaxID=2578109 RepID=UPI00110FD528|nr:dUTP diphosphatase [Mycobacterium sp. KBS0706]TSD90755.1 dUTP diphosphatase [Mycobacterium sp. KBS0706]
MTEAVSIAVTRLPHGTDLPLPAAATAQSAGLDLLAAVAEPVTVAPGRRVLIPTGIAIALPNGWEAQVRPRSGLALKHGITIVNAPGTIDSDYRGEIGVVLINHGDEPVAITRGMRIAQMIVARHATVAWDERPNLDTTVRGTGGYGSTGTGA